MKNTKIIDYSERKNEEEIKVFEKLKRLFETGKASRKLSLESYFDGTSKDNLFFPFLERHLEKQRTQNQLKRKKKRLSRA